MDKARTQIDLTKIDVIFDKHKEQRWPLIPLLQDIQEEFGFIPKESVAIIAQKTGLFPTQVQGVISFYEQLYSEPRGKNIVRVCRGTACHVKGGSTILKLVKQQLGIQEGQTTPDWEYTLETVACIGVCALAPNVTVGNQVYGQMNPKKAEYLFEENGG